MCFRCVASSVCVCMCTVSMQEPTEGIWSPGTGGTNDCEPPGQFWDPNLSDLEGQPVPSLQFQALIDCSLVPEFVWLILSVFQSLVMVISKACRKIGAENDGTFRYARVPLPGNSDVSVHLHLALCGFWWFQVSMPSALSLLSRTTLLLSEETFEETFHLKSRRTHLDQFFSESILLR